MLFIILVSVAVTVANGQGPIPDYRINPYYDESPKPYAFNYNALLDDGVGQSSRSETADGSGRVQGSYSLTNDEGHFRQVDYVADENGFRAVVRTNEPGTESKNPADVVMDSQAGPAAYAPGIRRPILNAAVEPIVPVVAAGPEPVVIPENILQPVRRPVYRRPGAYTGRNYAYRPTNRYPSY